MGATYNPTTNKFICGSGKTVLSWSTDVSSLSDAESTIMEGDIAGIHTVNSSNFTLVVLSNGTVVACDQDMATVSETEGSISLSGSSRKGSGKRKGQKKQTTTTSGSQVLYTNYFSLSSENGVLTTYTNDGSLSFYLVAVEASDRVSVMKISSHSLSECGLSRDISSLSSCSFDGSSRSFAILFGDDGVYESISFPSSGYLPDALRCEPSVRVSRALNVGDCSLPLALGFVASGSVSICGVENQNSTASSPSLTIWDTVYGVVQHVQTVSGVSSSTSKKTKKTKKSKTSSLSVQQANSLFAASDRYFAFTSNGFTYVFETPSNSGALLSMALGRMEETQEYLAAEVEVEPVHLPTIDFKVTSESKIDQSELLDGLSKHLETDAGKASEGEKDAADTLCDTNKTKTLKSFKTAFSKFLSGVSASTSGNNKRKIPGGSTPSSKRTSKNLNLSQYFVSRVGRRCVESHFWEPLITLLESNVFSVNYAPEMVSVLTEEKETATLEKVLIHVHDIVESDLVRVVKFATDSIKSGSQIGEDFRLDEEDHPMENFLHMVLSSSNSPDRLTNALASLPIENVVIFMRYLHKWVTRYWNNAERNIRASAEGNRIPSFAMVLVWCSAVIDAHFAEICTMRELDSLVMELQTLISVQHLGVCEQMETLKGQLKFFRNRKNLPMPPIQDYGIEVLRM